MTEHIGMISQAETPDNDYVQVSYLVKELSMNNLVQPGSKSDTEQNREAAVIITR